jgi:hypothetical protein
MQSGRLIFGTAGVPPAMSAKREKRAELHLSVPQVCGRDARGPSSTLDRFSN